MACSMQRWRGEVGRLGLFYHVNDVSVYLGRQREEGVPDQNYSFCARVLYFEPRVVRFSLCEHLKLKR